MLCVISTASTVTFRISRNVLPRLRWWAKKKNKEKKSSVPYRSYCEVGGARCPRSARLSRSKRIVSCQSSVRGADVLVRISRYASI